MVPYLTDSPLDTLTSTLSNTGLWGAIIATVGIIFFGWLFVKIKWFKAEWKPCLTSLVVNLAFPALLIKGFMTTTPNSDFSSKGVLLGVSALFYILGGLGYVLWTYISPKLLTSYNLKFNKNAKTSFSEETLKIKGDKSINFWMMCIYGSTVFFGLPVVKALFGQAGEIDAILWNVPFNIGLASFCQFQYLGIKFKKENKKQILKAFTTPVLIATVIGLIFWLTQLIPGARVTIDGKETAWFDLGITAKWLFNIFNILASLTSPLIWLAIGVTLAESSLKKTFLNKEAWAFSVVKLMIIPLIMLLLLSGLGAGIGSELLSTEQITTITILMATPPATICVAYAIRTNRQADFASSSSIISTLLCAGAIPFWAVIAQLLSKSIMI